MALYTQAPKELLLSLIREANPNLPLPLNAEKINFGKPKSIPLIPGSTVNTEVVLSTTGNSGYVRKVTVKYTKISLDTLFRGLDAEVHKYTAAGPGSFPFDMYGLLKEINLRFGLNLTEDDVDNTWFPYQNDKYYPDKRSSQAVLKAKPDSLAWSGQVTIRWVSDLQSIGDMVTKQDLPSRSFPGGKSIGSSKYTLNCATYDADFGEFTKEMNNPYMGFDIGNPNAIISALHDELLNAINTVTSETYTKALPPTAFGLGGIVPRTYILPNDTLSEANSKDFNRVMVLQYPDDGGWGVGKLLLHYNV